MAVRANTALSADGCAPRRAVLVAMKMWGAGLGVHLWRLVGREQEAGRIEAQSPPQPWRGLSRISAHDEGLLPWAWDGRHYARTANAWLSNLDARRSEALWVLAGAYGEHDAVRWLGRWRIFLMACAGLFGYAQGTEWGVAHYRFARIAGRHVLAAAS